jgi:hypothetical protein
MKLDMNIMLLEATELFTFQFSGISNTNIVTVSTSETGVTLASLSVRILKNVWQYGFEMYVDLLKVIFVERKTTWRPSNIYIKLSMNCTFGLYPSSGVSKN